MKTNCSLAMTLILLAATATNAGEKQKAKPPIAPRFEECELIVGDRTLKPSRFGKNDASHHWIGDRRIVIEEDQLRAFQNDADVPLWTIRATEDSQFTWLSEDDQFGYIAETKKDEKKSTPQLEVRRLDLKTGQWKESLPVPAPAEKGTKISVGFVLAENDWVYVLSYGRQSDDEHRLRDTVVNYRVTAFKKGEAKHIWSRSFSSGGNRERQGVYLWASRMPEAVNPDFAPLTVMGDRLLVCSGPIQDIHCVKRESGETSWSIERIWEYRRGFIGPSVWSHFIARRGEDPWIKVDKKKANAEKKDDQPNDPKEESNETHFVIGGPVLVRAGGKRNADKGSGDARIFVATGRAPRRFADYLIECTAYELDADGRPVSMTTLPRAVQGGRFRVLDDGVVWSCNGGAIVRLGVTQRERIIDIGPGGPDCLTNIEWFRQLRPKKVKAWLTTDPAGDPVALGAECAFRVRTGGYVKTENERVYRFPIAAIDYQSGQESELLLSVPFEGKLPLPESNYSTTKTEDGTTSHTTRGPYLLAVTLLRCEGTRIDVTLGMENGHRTLSFDLPLTNRAIGDR